jgi:hypothetical protein
MSHAITASHCAAGDDPDKMIRGDPGVEEIYEWGASMNIPTRGASGQGEGCAGKHMDQTKTGSIMCSAQMTCQALGSRRTA